MRVLVACEMSGVVRDAFLKRGHDAVSCDILPAANSGPHLQCDALSLLDDDWDLMIAHPPCTYLSVSGLHWNKKRPERQKLTDDALEFVRRLLDCPIPRICIENPISCISSKIRKPDQIIQPYDFGDNASKATCLWLKNLPILLPSKRVSGRFVEWPPNSGKLVERWSNQTDSGQNKLGPSAIRAQLRSKTYDGIAESMSIQWNFDT